ncbi:hypothetical protein L6270_00470 [Candidatus Parcubacteria bacterium]|nr:hypothetical protein [Patescibacteria group bacterium]MBU4309622.1 hypothetical protein [Patescibacteria group bacterium]MBU4577990.1 hypothetical protein [Patescibacteria group bacterium]MCG2696502.1 hypothetical protein [Candidatus Parcubacteria bacterium]
MLTFKARPAEADHNELSFIMTSMKFNLLCLLPTRELNEVRSALVLSNLSA